MIDINKITGEEFVIIIRKLVLKKMQLRKILNRYVQDVSTARYFNQKIFDINYEINKLFKQYMGQ